MYACVCVCVFVYACISMLCYIFTGLETVSISCRKALSFSQARVCQPIKVNFSHLYTPASEKRDQNAIFQESFVIHFIC